MRKIFNIFFLFLIVIFLYTAPSYSQRWKLTRYEIMGGIGGSYGMMDIGGYSWQDIFSWKKSKFGLAGIDILGTRPSIFLGARYKITEKVAVKMNFIFGWVGGRDDKGGNPTRMLRYNTFIFEPSGQIEYSFFKENPISAKYSIMNLRGGIRNQKFSINVYAFLGAGAPYYDAFSRKVTPDTTFDVGHYSGFTFAIPAGIGIKHLIRQRLAVSLEIGGRWTFNDYLDAYTSKYSKSNDLYAFFNLSVVYKLRTNRKGLPIIKYSFKF